MGLSNYLPNSRISQPGVCTSSTRPVSPYEGQVIYETDTDRIYCYTGSSWEAVWFAATPSFYAHRTSVANVTNTSVIEFQTATLNIGSCYNTSNSRFTAPVDGIYSLNTRCLSDNNQQTLDIRFAENGVINTFYSGITVSAGATNQYRQAHLAAVINLSAGDYITVNHASGGTSAYYGAAFGHTAFWGHWVGPA
jgi:hypothetical protein